MTTLNVTHATAATTTSGYAPGDASDLRSAAISYWSESGWPVRVVPGAVVLTLGDELAGLVVDQGSGADLLAVLAAREVPGSAVTFSGHGPSMVLLTQRDDALQHSAAAWHDNIPYGTLLADHFDLALPPTILPTGPVTWATQTNATNIQPFAASALWEAAVTLNRFR